MRIETHVDLYSAWHSATVAGKIIFLPLLAIAFVVILVISIYTAAIVEFGSWAGFFVYDEDESEEDQETDRGDSEVGEE